jgi:uncharacterized protein (DUF362 family)
MRTFKSIFSGREILSNNVIIHYHRILAFVKRIFWPLVGLFAFTWFLIRVVPKPSRAAYPCQKAAFPLAAGFILWITTIISSSWLFKKAIVCLNDTKIKKAVGLFLIASVVLFGSIILIPENRGYGKKALRLFIPDDPIPDLVNSRISESVVYPESMVGLVQSDKESVTQIDAEEIDQMVRNAVDYAGGLDNIIENGNTVILKPNLVAVQVSTVSREFLTPGANGVVTDYRIIQSAVNIVRELNPDGKIILLEGSATGFTRENMDLMEWDKITGLDQVIYLEEESGDWQDINAPELVKVSLPENKALYEDAGNVYYMNKIYYEADVVISIPCLKNHAVADITGGVKNVALGVSPANIYGPGETEFLNGDLNRYEQGIDHGYLGYRTPLHYWIHDYYLCKPVDFVIMDGLNGLENGPLASASLNNDSETLSDDQKNMRLILASSDAIAVDAVEALVMGVDPKLVRYLTYLHNNGAGCADPFRIRIRGNKNISSVKKQFENGEDGANAMYFDFDPPDFWIRSFNIHDNILSLSLTTNEDNLKVEFKVNGDFIDPIVIGDYENISIELPDTDISEYDIEIIVSDRYLNEFSRKLQVTDLEEFRKNSSAIKVYPNPASNYLFIQFDKTVSSDNYIEIFDLKGNLMYHKNHSAQYIQNKNLINIRHFPKGNYILKVGSDQEHYIYKITKL